MMPGLIFAVSFLTLLQFFVFYTRSVIAELKAHELSAETREICGVTTRSVPVEKFPRLLQLLDLCPEREGDGFKVRAVAFYFRLLGLASDWLSWAIPSVTPWIEAERGCCAYAAAAALDRRIAYSRSMMTQQASQ
jgi:hypothetical protein